MTPQQLEKIAVLREGRGWSYKRIGKAIGMSPGAVSWYCLREAIEPPNPRKPVTEVKGPMEFKRGDHVLRRFSPEDDTLILVLAQQRFTVRQIARRLGRADNSIRGRLMTLARREERLASFEAAE